MIWRDDDVPMLRRIDWLWAVDDVFQRYGIEHTVAIIAEDLTPDVARELRSRRMSCQLHCWSHEDLSSDAESIAKLPDAVRKVEDLIGTRPTVLYPPWNRASRKLEQAAAALGLVVSTKKISIDQYLRAGGDVREDVVNFHHWHLPDVLLLSHALHLAKGQA